MTLVYVCIASDMHCFSFPTARQANAFKRDVKNLLDAKGMDYAIALKKGVRI